MNKKTLRSLLQLLLFIAIVSVSARCPAQSRTFGIGGGYASHNHGGYANLYFQFSLAQHVRLAPEVGCAFKSKEKSALLTDIDVQFPFNVSSGVNIYPLLGVAFHNWNNETGHNQSRLGADLGGGFDFNITPSLKLTVQAKYTFMNDTGGAYAGLGIGYNF